MKQKKSDNFSVSKYVIFAAEFIVATIITYGVYQCKPKVMKFYQERQAITQIQKVIDFIRSDYDPHFMYYRINNEYTASKAKDKLQKYGLVFHYDGIVNNYYGGNFLVFPSKKFPSTNQYDAFVLGYGSLLRERCIFLATYDWRKISGVTPMAVLASSVEQYTNILDETSSVGCVNKSLTGIYSLACNKNGSSTFPMTLQQAQSACSCPSGECFVAVKFY